MFVCNEKEIEEFMYNIEMNASDIDKKIDFIIKPHCEELDSYVEQINNALIEDSSSITDEELDQFVMNLSTMLYFLNTGVEQLGVADDMSRLVYKDAYNTARNLIEKGTVADKNSQAELEAVGEHLVNLIYNKSYKILKSSDLE